jgi:putative iron-regulated protein
MRKHVAVSLFLVPLVLVSCSSGPDLKPVIENYSDIVLASYRDALTDAKELHRAVLEFTKSPSDSTLQAAKEAWLAARETYGKTEAFRFYGGPIDDEDGPEARLNAWPLDESYIDYVMEPSTGEVESNGVNIINSPKTFPDITKELIASLNERGGETNVSSGYHAVEFLLWGQDLSDGPGGGARPYTDYVAGPGGTHEYQERRAKYLNETAALIVDDLQSLVREWTPGGDNYRAFFNSPDQLKNSLERILNGVGKLSKGELAGERMFVPFDLRSKEDEHSCFSDNTHRDIVVNAIGIRNVLTGSYTRLNGDIMSGPSVLDVIAEKNTQLAEEIRTTLDASVTASKQIQAPFDQEILDREGRQRVLKTIRLLREQGDLIAEAAAEFGFTVNPDAI